MFERAAAVLVLLSCSLPATVRVWQSTITLPTYDEGLPDDNPPFLFFHPTENEIYPYTVRNKLTLDKSPKTWRTLEIENEYLRCTVLPDLGGRIYYCFDKIGKRDLFYANPAIKKYPAGLRTAWVAAGTEFNFPVGHSWMTVSPVDFATTRNPDGSASIWVAATDRAYRMRWEVEITLRPGVDALEQHVTLSNPTALSHRYYWWNNAEIPAFEDTRFYLPCRVTSSHGQADLDTWPADQAGVDISRLANHQGDGVARFGIGCREPFMGVYSTQDGGGTAHYADPKALPGKKIWSWGSAHSRAESAKALTDNGTQYVELQAGLFQDQETFGFLEPGQSLRFTEYWMPLRAIGGLSRLTRDAALFLDRSGKDLIVSFQAYRSFEKARLRLSTAQNVALEETLDLVPEQNYRRLLQNADPAAKYKVELVDSTGNVLLRHIEDSYSAMTLAEAKQLPLRNLIDPPQTEADFLHKGNDDEQLRNGLIALETYDRGLIKFPASQLLALAAGRVALGLNRFQETIDRLLKLPPSAEASYYLGVAYLGLGEDLQARAALAAWREGSPYAFASRFQLAQLMARWGDVRKALLEVRKLQATQYDPTESWAFEVALLRHLGRKDEAGKCLDRWLSKDPANLLLRLEAVRLGRTDDALWQRLAADPQGVLDLAVFYMRTGMYQDAIDLLGRQYPEVEALQRELGDTLPQDNPLIAYYRGFCRMKLGLPPGGDLQKASQQSTLYVFPNRPESFQVLRAALQANPSDATAHFLLGSLYLAGGLPDPAMEEWKAAYDLHGNFPGLHANLGRLLVERKKDNATALKVFEEGIQVDPRNQTLQDGLAKSIEDKKAVLAANTAKPTFFVDHTPPPASKPEELAQLALSMLESDRLAEAAGVFTQENFAKEKQSEAVREAFIEVRLQTILAKAKRKECDQALSLIDTIGDEDQSLPFSLYGFGGVLKSARIQYYMGVAEQRCGDEKAARKRWSKASKSSDAKRPNEFAWSQMAAVNLDTGDSRRRLEAALEQVQRLDASPAERSYAGGLLLIALGKRPEAAERLQMAIQEAGNDILLKYLCRIALSGN